MKTTLSLIASLAISISLFAQAPQLMNYQAVARDQNGNIVPNQLIGLQISIHHGTQNGPVVFSETHNPTTNGAGLFTTHIGGGTLVSGDFSTIDWANGPFYTEVEMDPTGGSNYTVSGTEQLLSVPYALHAESSSSLVTGSGGNGGTGYIYQQEIVIAYNSNDQQYKLAGGTSDLYGDEAYISYFSGDDLLVTKIFKDPNTGMYYLKGSSSDYNATIGTNNINYGQHAYCGMALLNNYVYVGYIESGVFKITRLDANNLSASTDMNIIGGIIGVNDQQKAMYTDGVSLFVYNYRDGADCIWTKLSVSGTNLTVSSTLIHSSIFFGSFGDGNDIYHIKGSFSTTNPRFDGLELTDPNGATLSSSDIRLVGHNLYNSSSIDYRAAAIFNIDASRLYIVSGESVPQYPGSGNDDSLFKLVLTPISKP